jgi:5-methylcytosine-specific restriction enzyme subunit McrC
MSEPDRVVLTELDKEEAVHRLDQAHVGALRATKLVRVERLGDGSFRLRATDRVGAVRIGDLEVEVKPKTPISRILFMLGYAKHPGFVPEDVSGQTEPDLWPALAESLARQVEQALRSGVAQGYATREDSLALVRGRIRVADQIARRPGGWLPLEVSYDDYAADTPENRLLRTAVRRMMAVPGLREEHRVRLSHLDGRLDGVRVLAPGVPTPAWRPTRLNARYVPALLLAEAVLRNQSVEPGPGGLSIAGFVVNMNKVFEDFVCRALAEALARHRGHADASYHSYLDEEQHARLEPDLVHLIGERPVAVFDAKYKLGRSKGRYQNPDLYQMFTYCTALGLKTGWLVYAHGTAQGVRHVRNTDITIIQRPLDLAVAPQDLLSEVDDLAREALEPSQ